MYNICDCSWIMPCLIFVMDYPIFNACYLPKIVFIYILDKLGMVLDASMSQFLAIFIQNI